MLASDVLAWSSDPEPMEGHPGGDAQFTSDAGFYAGGNDRKGGGSNKVTLAKLVVTPGTASVQVNSTQQFVVQAYDTKGNLITPTPTVSWAASIGKVDGNGLFASGQTSGKGLVTVSSGKVSASADVDITVPADMTFQNAALEALVESLYVDQSISRPDMIQILRSAGDDGTVGADELADLRMLVTTTEYAMPSYVRGLAYDVVHQSPANLKFQGQTAGNLEAGSSSTLLNILVDKWFFGADVPAVLGSGIEYRESTGTLFVNTPSLNDAKQGMVGDCYLIASLVSIANKSPQAIYDMFLDNGDGTFTVRFFGAGIADFVTVNRRLPTYSNGTLAYAGYGFSALSSSTTLWVALAEKAYAQWNETGKAGRNGTNTYAGIEGGWMHNSNAQILGYSSTNHYFSSSTQQTLIDALSSGRAVTLGTNSSVSISGLVASHAYTVVRFDSATSTFVLDNPWGFQDPTPLTWSQLAANCVLFTVTSPAGSGSILPPGGVGSSASSSSQGSLADQPKEGRVVLRFEETVFAQANAQQAAIPMEEGPSESEAIDLWIAQYSEDESTEELDESLLLPWNA